MNNILNHFKRAAQFTVLMLMALLLFSCETQTGNNPLSQEVNVQESSIGAELFAGDNCIEGQMESGAFYLICVPDDWNGDLVIYAHGYVSVLEPVAIPESQLYLPDGTFLPELLTDMGYAFATTSYRENGFALENAVLDVEDLANLFNDLYGEPTHRYLVGASEGGLVTTKSVEKSSLFSGGLAVCGPIGSMSRQINYIGDFRVLFDYFFPGILPGSPVDIPDELMTNWESLYSPLVLAAISADPQKTQKLLRTAKAPADPADPQTAAETVLGMLWYNVFASNDLISRLGGQPFDNTRRFYRGSGNDRLLNRMVERIAGDPAALAEAGERFDTNGQPNVPLVTMHTIGDQIVPVWHANLYRRKIMASNNNLLFTNIPVMRYGHCNFTADEVLRGFSLMVAKVTALELVQVQRMPGQPLARR